MTTAATVLRPSETPGLAVVALALAAFQVVSLLALALVDMLELAALSGVAGLVFVAVAYYLIHQARNSSVTITQTELTVSEPGRVRVVKRADIASIDLSRSSGQVQLTDGSTLRLPLEGEPLLRAGLLLEPGHHPNG